MNTDSGWPTNPRYVRRLVKGMGYESVRVSPSTGDVSVKQPGSGWVLLGTTRAILAKAKAAHQAKYATGGQHV